MYKSLEMRLPNWRIIGRIESIDGVCRVAYAEDDLIKDSLERIINNGIEATMLKGKTRVIINTHPTDFDFLARIGQYLFLAFNYICNFQVSKITPEPLNEMGQVYLQDFYDRVGYSSDEPLEPQVRDYRQFIDAAVVTQTDVSPFGWVST